MIENTLKVLDPAIGYGFLLYIGLTIFLLIKLCFKKGRENRPLIENSIFIYLQFFGIFVAIFWSIHCTYKGRCYPDPNIGTIFSILISGVANIIIVIGASIYKKNRWLLLIFILNPIVIGFISDTLIKYFFK